MQVKLATTQTTLCQKHSDISPLKNEEKPKFSRGNKSPQEKFCINVTYILPVNTRSADPVI